MPDEGLDCLGCKRHQFKCCAFQPFIPNFLCGSWPTQSPKYHLLPIGLIATKEYRAKYQQSQVSKEHQLNHEMVCINYDLSNGQCRRWNQRPSECTAYHCESKAGEAGLNQWNKLAQDWHQLESDVAQMAMLEFGFDHREIAIQVEWIIDPPAAVELGKIWSHYFKNESDYFIKCSSWAKTLSSEQIFAWRSS